MVEKSGKRNAFVTRGRHVSKRWRTFDNNQIKVAVSNIVRKQTQSLFINWWFVILSTNIY